MISHTAWPGNNQPSIQPYYSYSDYNFLGYGGVFDWDYGEDNLYRSDDDYQYTSTVTVEGGPETKYTYNKFHLMVSAVQKNGTKQISRTVEYYALDYTAFEDQLPQYQMPKSVQTIYLDTASQASRTETTQHGFDEWGNPTQEISASGITTDRVYYSEAGESDSETGEVRCPPDPHGFRRYLKTETVTPAASSYPNPTRSKYYRYLELPTASGASTSYVVAAQQLQTLEETQCLSSTDYSYVNQPAARDHSRLHQQITRLSGQYPTTYLWTYCYPSLEKWTQTTQIESYDGHTVQSETSYSMASGLTLTRKDEEGIETVFQYDKLGRQIKSTVSPGTPYEATRKHDYAVLEDETGSSMTVTDAKGVQMRYTADGLDRVCRVEKEDDDGQWNADNTYTGTMRVVEERSYNSLGQCIELVDVDWLRTAGQPTEQRSSRQLKI